MKRKNLQRGILITIVTGLGLLLISSYAFCKGSRPSQNVVVNPGQEASKFKPDRKDKQSESKIIIDSRLKLSKPLPLLWTKP